MMKFLFRTSETLTYREETVIDYIIPNNSYPPGSEGKHAGKKLQTVTSEPIHGVERFRHVN